MMRGIAATGLPFTQLMSLDVLLVGVVTAVVYDSRLNRRSPLPGGLSFSRRSLHCYYRVRHICRPRNQLP